MSDNPLTFAIDPGNTQSQFVVFNGALVVDRGFLPNVLFIKELPTWLNIYKPRWVVIEGIASYGMSVGAEVFETCIWIGRFYQKCSDSGFVPEIMLRREVKLHLCGTTKAKDGNVRQAIIDRFGGKDAAIGRKATPGVLYGITSHAWAALALAITFTDKKTGRV